MGATVDEVAALARIFPAHAERMRRLYMRDAAFRDICREYNAASFAIEYWKGRAAGGADRVSAERVSEYRRVLSELETEVAALLSEEMPEAQGG